MHQKIFCSTCKKLILRRQWLRQSFRFDRLSFYPANAQTSWNFSVALELPQFVSCVAASESFRYELRSVFRNLMRRNIQKLQLSSGKNLSVPDYVVFRNFWFCQRQSHAEKTVKFERKNEPVMTIENNVTWCFDDWDFEYLKMWLRKCIKYNIASFVSDY